ncbi:acid protease [Mycena epipterygia]|nr:acid protease [Mycena epipterygia]
MRGLIAALWIIPFLASTHAEFHEVRDHPLTQRSQGIPQATACAPFTGRTTRQKGKQGLLESLLGKSSKSTTVTLDGTRLDHEYIADVTIGGQLFKLQVDTGSSDTWVAKKGFSCVDPGTGAPEPLQTCAFGPTFDPSKSKTFQSFPNVIFDITYGDGTFVHGPVGFDTVSIGGLSVTKQEIGVPNVAATFEDGVTSGILGLAFPALTSVFNTTDPTKVSFPENQLPYNPFFFSAIAQNKVKNPYFSVALNRPSFAAQLKDGDDPNLGYLAFGGIVPVPVSKTAVTVPLVEYLVGTNPNPQYVFYGVHVDAYTFPGSTSLSTAIVAIVDTGTTLNLVPDNVAAAFNAQFKPKAQLDPESGLFIVNCNAKAPAFSVTIGGKVFTVDPRDLILPAGTDDKGNLLCISGVTGNGPNVDTSIFVLGDVFLHNVVTTFAPTQHEVTITQRSPY